MKAKKIAYMVKWASRYGATLETHGEVGFGWPCVGITVGSSYADFEWTWNEWDTYGVTAFNQATPEDAYHKHPCMAVLVHDEDYEAALKQLYKWVKWCDENNWGITVEPRQVNNVIEAILYGGQIGELRNMKANPA